jgi:hypothetical protein
MAYKKLEGTSWDGNFRSDYNQNLENIEVDMNQVKAETQARAETAIAFSVDAKAISTSANDKASRALTNSQNTQAQIDNLVVKGDSSPAATQASVDRKGKVFPTLKARVDNEQRKIENQKVLFDYTGLESQFSYIPQLTKFDQNPVFSVSQSALTTIYWVWVVPRVDKILPNARGKYYMYYSTDHDPGAGGIALAYSNDPRGPWTDVGMIFQDTAVANAQTETPSVVWNPYLGKLQMFYHNDSGLGRGQTTTYATSDDGENWTPSRKIVVDPEEYEFPGDAHTGYFKPFIINGEFYAYHLMGGQDYPHCGLSYSQDGDEWMIDPRPLNYCTDITMRNDLKIGWNTSCVFNWKGELYWIGYLSNFVSGAAVKDGKIAMAPLSDDLRSFKAPVQEILPVSQAWETTNIKSLHAMVDEGILYVYYQTDNNFGLAVAE